VDANGGLANPEQICELGDTPLALAQQL